MLDDATGLLCALWAAVFATTVSTWLGMVGLVLAFLTAAWTVDPQAAWMGPVVAVVAGAVLVYPGMKPAATIGAGVLAGWWASALEGEGVPIVLAWGLALAVPTVSAWLTVTRRTFAPRVLHEHALLAVGLAGVLMAAGPSVVAGWRSATVLNLEPSSAAHSASLAQAWVFVVTAVAAVLGGAHTMWWRR